MLQPFNQILLIYKSDYLLILDQDNLAWAAYMKQLKKYVIVMSNLRNLEYTKQGARQLNSNPRLR